MGRLRLDPLHQGAGAHEVAVLAADMPVGSDAFQLEEHAVIIKAGKVAAHFGQIAASQDQVGMVAVDRLGDGGEGPVGPHIIGIEKADIVAVDMGKGLVAGGGEAVIGLTDHLNPWIRDGLQDLWRVIGGAIIHDHILKITKTLHQDRLDGRQRRQAIVEGGGDASQLWHWCVVPIGSDQNGAATLAHQCFFSTLADATLPVS